MTAKNYSPHMKRPLTRMAFAVVALAIGVCFLSCSRTEQKPAGSPEKITIAYATLPETALAQIAQSRSYYRAEGLEATAHLHPYGKLALKEVLEGKADIATGRIFLIMCTSMGSSPLSRPR